MNNQESSLGKNIIESESEEERSVRLEKVGLKKELPKGMIVEKYEFVPDLGPTLTRVVEPL